MPVWCFFMSVSVSRAAAKMARKVWAPMDGHHRAEQQRRASRTSLRSIHVHGRRPLVLVAKRIERLQCLARLLVPLLDRRCECHREPRYCDLRALPSLDGLAVVTQESGKLDDAETGDVAAEPKRLGPLQTGKRRAIRDVSWGASRSSSWGTLLLGYGPQTFLPHGGEECRRLARSGRRRL